MLARLLLLSVGYIEIMFRGSVGMCVLGVTAAIAGGGGSIAKRYTNWATNCILYSAEILY